MFRYKKLKEDFDFLEDQIDDLNNQYRKTNKTLRILIEQLEENFEDEIVKKSLNVLLKTLRYYG